MPDMHDILPRILDRAEAMAKRAELPLDRLGLALDLALCQHRMPMRWAALLAADDFNFSHDVFGIHHHIDRQTGYLRDCFLPRYHASTKDKAA